MSVRLLLITSALLLAGCTTKIVVISPSVTVAPQTNAPTQGTVAVPTTISPTAIPSPFPTVAPQVAPVEAAAVAPPVPAPPLAPTPLPAVSLSSDDARTLATQFFSTVIRDGPDLGPGSLRCGPGDYRPDSALWLVECAFAPDGGYVPGFGPKSMNVQLGVASPLKYSSEIVGRTVVVEDKTGVTR